MISTEIKIQFEKQLNDFAKRLKNSDDIEPGNPLFPYNKEKIVIRIAAGAVTYHFVIFHVIKNIQPRFPNVVFHVTCQHFALPKHPNFALPQMFEKFDIIASGRYSNLTAQDINKKK